MVSLEGDQHMTDTPDPGDQQGGGQGQAGGQGSSCSLGNQLKAGFAIRGQERQ